MSTARGDHAQRAGFIALWILGGIAHQVRDDTRAGVLSAKALFRSWMTEYWPRVPPAVRAPLFAIGVSARSIYRAGHYGGRTIAVGVRNGVEEGQHRHREYQALREHPKGSQGHTHLLAGFQRDRRERADGYRMYAEQVHGAAVQHREERLLWARAETLADLGEVTARWVEGGIQHHPAYGGTEVDEETRGIVPALAALNRSGFVTNSSQPGQIGPSGWGWDIHQRAAVVGFTDKATAGRLEAACTAAGLVFINNGPAKWRTTWKNATPTTATPVSGDRITEDSDYHVHTTFGTHTSRRGVKFDFDGYGADALLAAEQVTVIDPQWGRDAYMWDVLTGALTDPPPTDRPTGRHATNPDTPPASTPAGPPDHVTLAYTGDIPHYPGEPTEHGGWRVTTGSGNGLITHNNLTRQHAEQLAEWWRWRSSKGDGGFGEPGDVTVEPMNPGEPTSNGHRPASHTASPNGYSHNNNGGNPMTTPATGAAPTSTDQITTPALRLFWEKNATEWAGLQDHLATHNEFCKQQLAGVEAIVGGLTADRHDPATVAEATAVLDALHQSGQIADQHLAASEHTQAAMAAAHQGLERARAAEDAHASFPGGPARNFDAYAQQ